MVIVPRQRASRRLRVKARRSKAIATLALLSGGVSLARAVNDPAFSKEIAKGNSSYGARGGKRLDDSRVYASGRK